MSRGFMRGELARLEAAASRYMRSKWWARAVETYEELVKHEPHKSGYRVSLAEAYLKMNRKLDAIRIYMSLLDIESKEPTSRLMEYHKAILAIDRSHTESYIRLGDILVARKLYQDAKSQYLLAVRQFEKSGTFGKAAETLRRIEDLDFKNPYVKIHLANIYYKKGDTRDAVENLWSAAQLLKESVALDDARMVLEEILALDPSHKEADKELKKLGGERPQSKAPEEKSAQRKHDPNAPLDRDSMLRKAEIALGAGEVAKAAGTLERACTLYPKDPRVKLRLGEIYEKRRMIEDAVQAFWETISIYMETGERAEARELLVRLLELDPGHYEAQILLAKIEVDRSKEKKKRGAAPRAGEAMTGIGRFLGGEEPPVKGEPKPAGGPGIFAFDEHGLGSNDLLAKMLNLGAGEGPSAGLAYLEKQPPGREPDQGGRVEPGDLDKLFGPGVMSPDMGDPLFHYQRGLAYLELGLLSEALDEFMLAAEVPEKAADAYQLMGICYKNKGMLKNALSCFEKGLDAAINSDAGGIQLIENLERLVDETSSELGGGEPA